MFKFDLHIHSTLSDGDKSPAEIILMAVKNKVKLLSITDHDIISAKKDIADLLKTRSLTFIHGIEINCRHKSQSMEILGYYIDPAERKLRDKLKEMREFREKRAEMMIRKLNEKGFGISVERVAEISGQGTIGRPHLAKALLEKGYIKTLNEAFRKYLGDKSPCYVSRMKLDVAEAIALVRNAGGVPVHSHPGFFKARNLKNHLIELKKLGLMGVEVFYPYPRQLSLRHHSKGRVTQKKYENYLLSLCDELDLIPTGGTDYHSGGNYGELADKISHGSDKMGKLTAFIS